MQNVYGVGNRFLVEIILSFQNAMAMYKVVTLSTKKKISQENGLKCTR